MKSSVKRCQAQGDAGYIAVIDTETNWDGDLMSIGVVIARRASFCAAAERYYIITPECHVFSLYGFALGAYKPATQCSRQEAVEDLRSFLDDYRVTDLFAYNAKFDNQHMPELNDYIWHDIMRIAAYRQYNHTIPEDAECFSTGRLKSNYGVEPVLRWLLGDPLYRETHNAMCDAKDELQIMALLDCPAEMYPGLQDSAAQKTASVTREQRREQTREYLRKRGLLANAELVGYIDSRSPVTFCCHACRNHWDVSYAKAMRGTLLCPRCAPKPKPPKKKALSAEERFAEKEREFLRLISAGSGNGLRVLQYRGSTLKATAQCAACGYTWDIRPDHLKDRCYCPQCRKAK